MLLDGDAHRHGEDLVGEDGHLVGLAVAVGVFEDLDLVGVVDAMEPRIAAAREPVVQPLGDPDPAARVDVDVGRVHEHRLGGPECCLQTRSSLEPAGRFHRADLSGRRGCECPLKKAESEQEPGSKSRAGFRLHSHRLSPNHGVESECVRLCSRRGGTVQTEGSGNTVYFSMRFPVC